MASRRILKKDIDYLVSDLILDCYACMEEHPEKDFSIYEEIINEAIVLKDDLFEKINHFDPATCGNSHAYFLNLRKDLFIGITQSYDKLKNMAC
jgi:hypothetical protein